MAKTGNPFMTQRDQFFSAGWCKFEKDDRLLAWIDHALPFARATLNDPAQDEWLRYQGTWFAGVNALPNDDKGNLPDGTQLAGNVIDFIHDELNLPSVTWDKAQVSICYPGYPKPMDGETPAQHNFRVKRDAAHVDGLRGHGTPKRRYLEEAHAFILGLPMVEASADASPFVVWEGSHHIMREAFTTAFQDVAPDQWSTVDLTEIYKQARKQCFDTCKRVELHGMPGEAYLAHRLSLHGVAPWAEGATAGLDGRMICYFRPEVASIEDWLNSP